MQKSNLDSIKRKWKKLARDPEFTPFQAGLLTLSKDNFYIYYSSSGVACGPCGMTDLYEFKDIRYGLGFAAFLLVPIEHEEGSEECVKLQKETEVIIEKPEITISDLKKLKKMYTSAQVGIIEWGTLEDFIKSRACKDLWSNALYNLDPTDEVEISKIRSIKQVLINIKHDSLDLKRDKSALKELFEKNIFQG